jgi:hypothetical protein
MRGEEIMDMSFDAIRDRINRNYAGEFTMSGYEMMVGDIKERLGVEDDPDYNPLEDVTNHGADAGFSGFIYTTETVEFYDKHEQAIYDLLNEESEDMGYSNPEEMVSQFARSDMLDSPDGRKNLLAWFALETVARREVEDW